MDWLRSALIAVLVFQTTYAPSSAATSLLGAHLRITTGNQSTRWFPSFKQILVKGTLISTGDQFLILKTEVDDSLKISLDTIKKLEISRKKTKAPQGACIGLLAGLFVGGLVFDMATDLEGKEGLDRLDGLDKVWIPFLGLTAGTVAGGMIGKKIPYEQWQTIPLDDVRIKFSKRLTGLYLSTVMAF